MLMKIRLFVITSCILLAFILTNPTISDFKEYIKTVDKKIEISKENYNTGIGRAHNFLVCSLYSCRCEINTRINTSDYHYVDCLDKLYSVPKERLSLFLSLMGGKEVYLYKADSNEYKIPIEENEDFLKDFPYSKRIYPTKGIDTNWHYKLVDTTLHYIGILKNFFLNQ